MRKNSLIKGLLHFSIFLKKFLIGFIELRELMVHLFHIFILKSPFLYTFLSQLYLNINFKIKFKFVHSRLIHFKITKLNRPWIFYFWIKMTVKYHWTIVRKQINESFDWQYGFSFDTALETNTGDKMIDDRMIISKTSFFNQSSVVISSLSKSPHYWIGIL